MLDAALAAPFLHRLLRHPSPFARAWGAQAAARVGDAASLRDLARDPEPNVRTAAVQALAAVNRIGALAEEQGHHPNLYLAWGHVRVEIWTHKINGLTESDFILAAKIDEVV